MKTTTRWMTRLIAVCLSFAGFMTSAQATLVSTEQVAASEDRWGNKRWLKSKLLKVFMMYILFSKVPMLHLIKS